MRAHCGKGTLPEILIHALPRKYARLEEFVLGFVDGVTQEIIHRALADVPELNTNYVSTAFTPPRRDVLHELSEKLVLLDVINREVALVHRREFALYSRFTEHPRMDRYIKNMLCVFREPRLLTSVLKQLALDKTLPESGRSAWSQDPTAVSSLQSWSVFLDELEEASSLVWLRSKDSVRKVVDSRLPGMLRVATLPEYDLFASEEAYVEKYFNGCFSCLGAAVHMIKRT